MRFTYRLLLGSICSTLLAACGGGGSSSPPNADSAPLLTLSASPCFALYDISDSSGGSGLDVTVTDLALGSGIDIRVTEMGSESGTGSVIGTEYGSASGLVMEITLLPPPTDLGTIQISGRRIQARDGLSLAPSEEITVLPVTNDPCARAPEYIDLTADGLPEHDTGTFPNTQNPYAITEQELSFRVAASPEPAAQPVSLSANRFDGVMNNGVPIKMRMDSCAANTDCDLWHVNPLHEPSWYGIDSHNGRVLPDGTYHYLGDPRALYEDGADAQLQVIGIAADGYLIFGPWFDDNGVVRKASSSYQLKSGEYPPLPFAFLDPSGPITGQFIEDYEYVSGSGDLDECNGMNVNGVYGYFVTDTYPYLLNCFRGTPDDTFLINQP